MAFTFSCPFEPFNLTENVFKQGSLESNQYFMKRAYNLALEAWKCGEIPIGAVAVVDNEVVFEAFNQVEQKQDACAHAEMQILHALSQKQRDWRLTNVTLYVTKEPCPMCSGALFKTRIPKVFLGVYDSQQGCLGGCLNFNNQLKLYHQIQVSLEPLGGLCEQLLKTFFQLRRKQFKKSG